MTTLLLLLVKTMVEAVVEVVEGATVDMVTEEGTAVIGEGAMVVGVGAGTEVGVVEEEEAINQKEEMEGE